MRRREDGQTLTEFAFVLPIFLLLAFGILQTGLLMAGNLAFASGTRDAARSAAAYRIFGPTATQAACALAGAELRTRLAAAIPGFSNARLRGEVTYAQVAGPAGSPSITTITFRASYAQPLVVPLVGAIIDRADGVGAPGWAPAGETLVLAATESSRLEDSNGGGTITCAL